VVNGESTIINQLGLHARPAMSFVQLANGFSSIVRVRRADSAEWVDGKSIMQMLLLAATMGTLLEISCDGSDETLALAEIRKLIRQKFDEE
jgi:phosphocarrier protein